MKTGVFDEVATDSGGKELAYDEWILSLSDQEKSQLHDWIVSCADRIRSSL